MKILQIAPLVTPHNAYGGPTRVAMEQSMALAALGHNVILAGGSWGYETPPDRLGGARLKLFKAFSLSRGKDLRHVTSPGLSWWVGGLAPKPDVVHVHLARDLSTMPAAVVASRRGIPVFLQTHGMIVQSIHPLSSTIDRFFTRGLLESAAAAFVLNGTDEAGVRTVHPHTLCISLQNGVDLASPPPERRGRRGPIEVLFLARLHAVKRPGDFVAMAVRLAARFPNVRFRLIGPDEGEGPHVRAALSALSSTSITWDGPLAPDLTRAAMDRADIYVLPSEREECPMSLLEALAAGLPAVITEGCAMGPLMRDAGAALVTKVGAESIECAVASLIVDAEARARIGSAARVLAVSLFGRERVAKQLLAHYSTALRARALGSAGGLAGA